MSAGLRKVNFCLQPWYTLHLLPLIYPISTSMDLDPYSKYGSGSSKFHNTDPVNFLKKKLNHDPQFATQKSKGADSQAQWIGENDLLEGAETLGLLFTLRIGLLFTLRNRSGINSCYAYLLKV